MLTEGCFVHFKTINNTVLQSLYLFYKSKTKLTNITIKADVS